MVILLRNKIIFQMEIVVTLVLENHAGGRKGSYA